jgi:hypothetical protein
MLAQQLSGLTTAPGSGLKCDGCHKQIETSQVEYRCEGVNRASALPLRLHQWCYYVRTAAATSRTHAST